MANDSEDNVVFLLAEIGVMCFMPEPITLSMRSLIGLDLIHQSLDLTGQKPSEGDRLDPSHQNLSYVWMRVGGCWVGKPWYPHTCCLLCCPATSDLVLVRQIKGRFAACVGIQRVLIFSFRASFWADPHHLLLSAQGFLPLEMAAVGLSLPWLHPQGLVSDSCSWGPYWWISLAGGASFIHLLPGVTCILAP